MSVKKRFGIFLVVFVHAFVTADDLSKEFDNYMIQKYKTALLPDNPLYKHCKDCFQRERVMDQQLHEHRGIINEHREIINEHRGIINEQHKIINGLYQEVVQNARMMPYFYLKCAMKFMKIDGTQIFYDITGVGHLIFLQEMRPWPSRIQKIREDYDEYDEKKACPMYSADNHALFKKQDNESYNRWLKFVTDFYVELSFKQGEKGDEDFNECVEKWRLVASYLQGNLTTYYNRLDPSERLKRYGNDKKNFLENFAAIIQRGFRLACYFESDLEPKLHEERHEKYLNGTNIFLETAIMRHHAGWYFPQEHIDMYNILINATATDPAQISHMFPSVNVIRHNVPFVIPGMNNCLQSGHVTVPSLKFVPLPLESPMVSNEKSQQNSPSDT